MARRRIGTALGGICLLLMTACAAPPRGVESWPAEPAPAYRMADPPPVSDVDEVVQWARARLGVPYEWGGTGTYGFDCSGLVQSAYRHGGVNLPRTAQSQASRGRVVPRDQLQPGDLVFFGEDDDEIDHVGIVTRGTRFVHASSSRGVVEDSLTDGYFHRRFIFARRLSRSTASR